MNWCKNFWTLTSFWWYQGGERVRTDVVAGTPSWRPPTIHPFVIAATSFPPLFVSVDAAVDDADVFFVAVAWPSAAAFRAACGLEPRDFHITVGFRVKDLHQVPKGSETVVVDFADLSR